MSEQQTPKPVLNVGDVDLMDFGSPKGRLKCKLGRMGPVLGAEKLGAMLTIVEPGKCAFPFHVHHAIEEMFYIIEGSGEYRFGKESYPIKPGDLLAAPTGGPDRAHQIINTGTESLKYLAFSTMDHIDIVEYPDSKKFLTFSSEDGTPQTARMRYVGRKESEVEFFEGEDDDWVAAYEEEIE